MLDERSTVIYVGKAKRLRNRVISYFLESEQHTAKTLAMVAQVRDFDTIIVSNEFEAFLLENSLIKRHQPHYNILLKDGKGFPLIRLSREPYSRFEMVNKKLEDGARYFGPFGGRFATGSAIEALMDIARLPTCERKFPRDIGKGRPCLRAQMGRCAAPCRGGIGQAEYDEALAQACKLLEGKAAALQAAIKSEMEEAAEALLFEKAAQLRDRYRAVASFTKKQKVITASMADKDAIGVGAGANRSCAAVLHYIGGELYSRDLIWLDSGMTEEPSEIVDSVVKQLYLSRTALPREILLPCELEDTAGLEKILSEQAGHAVSLSAPKRGEGHALVLMAERNAREEMERSSTREEKLRKTLISLQNALGMEKPPRRIEAVDISNTGDTERVAALTAWEDGKPRKKSYRHYIIKDVGHRDDLSACREVITRRLASEENPLPDLFLIDGGKLHAQAAAHLATETPVAGMVKDSRHRTRALVMPDGAEVGLSANPALFAFIGKIQEETHRFAIEFHRKRRDTGSIKSELDSIEGVGQARRNKLLRHYGSIDAIRAATLEELSALVSAPVARKIKEHLEVKV